MAAARAPVEPFCVHGGRIDLARATFPGGDDWLDLSTGISPWAYPVRLDASVCAALPDPSTLQDLEAAAATVFGSDPAATIAVPGSDIALRLLARLSGASRVAVVRPGYGGHSAMWSNAAVTTIAAREIVAAASDHDTVVLARPNNPDGAIVDAGVLEAAAAALAARGGWLIVDEAFADVTPEIALRSRDGLVVLRSFGKFFGLAGLRLGFVVAPLSVSEPLRRMLGDWPVSGPAIAAGTAAYRDLDWQATQRLRIIGEAHRLDELLRGVGLKVVGGTALFRLVETPDATDLFLHLARHAVLTRPFTGQPCHLRIGLPGNDAGWAQLDGALGSRRLT